MGNRGVGYLELPFTENKNRAPKQFSAVILEELANIGSRRPEVLQAKLWKSPGNIYQ
jgi:hypothetical protein